jgi:hypothetical protein
MVVADPIDDAVSFVFGGRHSFYERVREVRGIPVLFRVLSATDTMATDLAADRIASPGASALERGIQCLARSIVNIDGQEYVGRFLPGDESPEGLAVLQARLEHLHGVPALFLDACHEQFRTVTTEYATLESEERLGE